MQRCAAKAVTHVADDAERVVVAAVPFAPPVSVAAVLQPAQNLDQIPAVLHHKQTVFVVHPLRAQAAVAGVELYSMALSVLFAYSLVPVQRDVWNVELVVFLV